MGIQLQFDSATNVIEPSLILATRGGDKIGKIPHTRLTVKDSFNEQSELSFDVPKIECKQEGFWEKITDFKLLWVKEWDTWFEIYVESEEHDGNVKHVTASELGVAELSQIHLHGLEINTEDAIENAERLGIDYQPIKFYNHEKPSVSLLHLLIENAPHYTIGTVSSTLRNMQRKFEFDGVSIMDALNDIAKEFECHFDLHCYTGSDGALHREINAYDMNANCLNCGYRGEFYDVCPKCGSTNFVHGLGNDTTVFLSTDNLAETITYSTDTDSVKNCFRLEGGDELMTATIRNSTPNGTGYLWYFSDAMRDDMSDALKRKMDDYQELYEEYDGERDFDLSQKLNTLLVASYNNLVAEYNGYREDSERFSALPYNTTTHKCVFHGYSDLMLAYYDAVDLQSFLQSELMPTVELTGVTAETEREKIATWVSDAWTTVAVENITIASRATVENTIKNVVKSMVDKNYDIDITTSSYTAPGNADGTGTWRGEIKLTNYSDTDDTATTGAITLSIVQNSATYVEQRINSVLSKATQTYSTDIQTLFKIENDNDFQTELYKWSHARLQSFYDACQSCVDILLTEQDSWGSEQSQSSPNILLTKFKTRLSMIGNQMEYLTDVIENVITPVIDGVAAKCDEIRNALNLQSYLGEALWRELCSFRRDEDYKNDNYISDGLSNTELFEKAAEFVETAKKEIYKSATAQHKIEAKIHNLLAMTEFLPLANSFKTGNWLRIRADGNVYRLRLLSYEVAFDTLNDLNVTFSDVLQTQDGFTDLQSIFNRVSSMSSTYDYVARQAKQGEEGMKKVSGWVNDGLALTTMKIVNNADNQDVTISNHGLLCRERTLSDEFDPRQIKIINNGLYYTTDNWDTLKAGVGAFMYYDPSDRTIKDGYGVIADTIVGNVILGENVGIYNTNNTFIIDENGMSLTTNSTDNSSVFQIQRQNGNTLENILSVTSTGQLNLNSSNIQVDMSGMDSYIRIAWNGISDYIQMENGELCVYTNADKANAHKLMAIGGDGMKLYGTSGGSELHSAFGRGSFTLSDGTTSGHYFGITTKAAQSGSGHENVLYFGLMADNGGVDGYSGIEIVTGRDGNNNPQSTTLLVGKSSVFGGTFEISTLGNLTIREQFPLITSPVQCYRDVNMYNPNGGAYTLSMGGGTIDMGGGDVINTSDVRLKKNISDTKIDALSVVNQIDVKEFDWIHTDKHENAGFIAQQLQTIAPELIAESDKDGSLSVKSMRILPYLVRAVQQISEELGIREKQGGNRKGGNAAESGYDCYTDEEKRAFTELHYSADTESELGAQEIMKRHRQFVESKEEKKENSK